MKKILYVMLGVGIIMTTVFGSLSASAAYEELIMQPVTVVNADFEAPIIYDASADTTDPYGAKKSDTILGWSSNGSSYDPTTPGDNKFTIEKDPANENNNCMMILDTRVAAIGLSTTNVWSDLIPVEAGATVQANLSLYLQYEKIGVNESDVSVNSRALYLKIWYFNSAGVSVGSAPQYSHDNTDANKNKWVAVSMPTVVAPAGTAYIRLNTMCTNTHTSKTYVDNVSVQVKKAKTISDPLLSATKLNPFDTVSMNLNIVNTAKTDFPVYTFFALYNSNGELTQLQTLSNTATLQTSGTIASSMELPDDVTGNNMRILVFNLKDGRIVPYYKWVSVDTTGTTK